MLLKNLIFLFFTLTSLFSGAAESNRFFSDPASDKIYRSLLEEFPQEIRGFDQTKESQDTLQMFQNDWQSFLYDNTPIPNKWFTGYSWSKNLSNFFKSEKFIAFPVDKKMLKSIKVRSVLQGPHSLENPNLYATQRIGVKISSELKQSFVKTIVYGGYINSVPASIGIKSSELRFLPSPYDAWGIRKTFVSGTVFPDGHPRFIMVIPPSRQYMTHYVQMFQYLGIKIEKSVLNTADQKHQISNLKKAFFESQSKLSEKADVIVLGYYDQFRNNDAMIKQLGEEIAIGEGVTLQLVEDRKTLIPIRYLLLKSDHTIWGESSAFLIQAALSLDPKAILFMGSAGGINTKTSIYDLSIPAEFILDGKRLPLRNEIYENLFQLKQPISGVLLGARHGHTNSPIEQTKAFVSKFVTANIDTFDVEEDLIAETVVVYNKKYRKNVLFGAVNLITDKPKSFNFDWTHEFDLNNINKNKKNLAREKAVSLAIQAIHHSYGLAKNSAHRPMFKKILKAE
jgi:hypothetical protein